MQDLSTHFDDLLRGKRPGRNFDLPATPSRVDDNQTGAGGRWTRRYFIKFIFASNLEVCLVQKVIVCLKYFVDSSRVSPLPRPPTSPRQFSRPGSNRYRSQSRPLSGDGQQTARPTSALLRQAGRITSNVQDSGRAEGLAQCPLFVMFGMLLSLDHLYCCFF